MRVSLVVLSSVVPLLLACPPPPPGDDAGVQDEGFVLEGLEGALLSVTGTARDDVWIVGADARDGTGPYVLHYDGDKLERRHTGDEGDLWWVSIAPDGDVWMAGDGGRVFRFEPGSESFFALPAPEPVRLYGILAFADDDVWAVGGSENDNLGVVWHYDGTAWSAPALPDGLLDGLVLFKVWGPAPDDLWIVGQGGAALRYLDGAWSRLELPVNRPIFTVHGNDELTVAVGGVIDALVLETEGGALADKTPELAPQLNGVFVNEDGSAVAAGYEGAIWQRGADGAWSALPDVPGTFNSYHAVYQDPDGGIWAVGGYLEFEPLQQGMLAYFGEEPISGEIVER